VLSIRAPDSIAVSAVRWIVGGTDVVENVRVDQRVRLIERLEDL